jgi:hypothetical protein
MGSFEGVEGLPRDVSALVRGSYTGNLLDVWCEFKWLVLVVDLGRSWS